MLFLSLVPPPLHTNSDAILCILDDTNELKNTCIHYLFLQMYTTSTVWILCRCLKLNKSLTIYGYLVQSRCIQVHVTLVGNTTVPLVINK